MIRYVYMEDFIPDCNSFLAEFSSVRARTQASVSAHCYQVFVILHVFLLWIQMAALPFFPRLVRWIGLWSSDILFVPLSSTSANIVAEQANLLSPEAGETPGR